MRTTKFEPILSRTYEKTFDFIPDANSIYIYGDGVEFRSSHVNRLVPLCTSVIFRRVESESQSSFRVDSSEYFLRSADSLNQLWAGLDAGTKVFIDITGLTHPVWAALLRSGDNFGLDVHCIYVEPGSYVRSNAPVDGQIYDLSSRINGVSPLAGFAVLGTPISDSFIFVPLLGFEGTRLKFLVEQVQPNTDDIFPVIGSPGFKPWFVFETFLGNRAALEETSSSHAVRYAMANCPFSCYYLLRELQESYPNVLMKIALIGTKPHALGAVLVSLMGHGATELVYDHPVRKDGRTHGSDRLHVYHVSALLKEKVSPIANATFARRRPHAR